MADAELQSEITEAMEEADIPFIVENGIVSYLQRDSAKVRKIKRRFQKGTDSSPFDQEAEVAMNDQHLEIYKRLFDRAGIPYEIKEFDGYYNILWRLKYADEVDQIVEDVGFEFYESTKNN